MYFPILAIVLSGASLIHERYPFSARHNGTLRSLHIARGLECLPIVTMPKDAVDAISVH